VDDGELHVEGIDSGGTKEMALGLCLSLMCEIRRCSDTLKEEGKLSILIYSA
jgi:hypothetical protein